MGQNEKRSETERHWDNLAMTTFHPDPSRANTTTQNMW